SEGNAFTRINNYFAQGIRTDQGDRMDGKIDHNISDKQRFSSRYGVNWVSNSSPPLIGNLADRAGAGRGRRQNFVADYTRTQSPTTIINVRFGILRRVS